METFVDMKLYCHKLNPDPLILLCQHLRQLYRQFWTKYMSLANMINCDFLETVAPKT